MLFGRIKGNRRSEDGTEMSGLPELHPSQRHSLLMVTEGTLTAATPQAVNAAASRTEQIFRSEMCMRIDKCHR
jgi:hypothetical protein